MRREVALYNALAILALSLMSIFFAVISVDVATYGSVRDAQVFLVASLLFYSSVYLLTYIDSVKFKLNVWYLILPPFILPQMAYAVICLFFCQFSG